jgi:hypothetical protein
MPSNWFWSAPHRMFRLRQSASGIEQSAAPFLPKQMNPQTILADLQMAFAATDVVQNNLMGTGLTVKQIMDDDAAAKQGAYTRTINRGDSTVISIHCETVNCWQSKLHFQNQIWNYSYTVTPVEVKP